MTTALRVVEPLPEPDPDERVRLVVRMLLGWHQMTEIDLGRRLGLKRTPIYNRMQGRTAFTVSEIVRMGEIFRVAPEAFLAGPTALLRAVSLPPEAVSIKKHPTLPGPGHPSRPTGRLLHLVAA